MIGQEDPAGSPTKRRILDAAMRLFGERGYAATTIADIEAAAGLSVGAGGIYRHFASKQALLEAGVHEQIAANRGLLAQLREATEGDLGEQLRALGHAGIARMEQEQDLNRLLFRDLRHHPGLLTEAATKDIRPVHAALASFLTAHDDTGALDVQALAVVVAGATSHFWLLKDVFGQHPARVSEQRFVAALAGLLETALSIVSAKRDEHD